MYRTPQYRSIRLFAFAINLLNGIAYDEFQYWCTWNLCGWEECVCQFLCVIQCPSPYVNSPPMVWWRQRATTTKSRGKQTSESKNQTAKKRKNKTKSQRRLLFGNIKKTLTQFHHYTCMCWLSAFHSVHFAYKTCHLKPWSTPVAGKTINTVFVSSQCISSIL